MLQSCVHQSLPPDQHPGVPACSQAGTAASAGAHGAAMAAAPAGSLGGGGGAGGSDALAFLAEVAGTHRSQQQQDGPELKRRRTEEPGQWKVEGAAREVAHMQAAAVGGGQYLAGQLLLAQDPQHPDRWAAWPGLWHQGVPQGHVVQGAALLAGHTGAAACQHELGLMPVMLATPYPPCLPHLSQKCAQSPL
jgi:hypothetical protein